MSATEIHETPREGNLSWVDWVSYLHWNYHQPGRQRALSSSTKRNESSLELYLGRASFRILIRRVVTRYEEVNDASCRTIGT